MFGSSCAVTFIAPQISKYIIAFSDGREGGATAIGAIGGMLKTAEMGQKVSLNVLPDVREMVE
jgi:hypothetical protein